MAEPITFMTMLSGFAALTYFIIRFIVTKVWSALERRTTDEVKWMRELAERQASLLENHLAHNTEALLALRNAIDELVVLLASQKKAAT